MQAQRLAIGAVILLSLVQAALSAEFSARLFGHEVAINRNDEGYRLEVDGREVLRNYYLFIDEIGLADGMPVVIGTSSIGGNACEGAPFVLSFPDDGAPRIDGPIEECRPVAVQFEGDQLFFSTGASPGTTGSRWAWTSANGFQQIGTVEFEPDASRGWTELRERTASHPADLFDYGAIADQIAEMAGADLPLVQRVLTGVGSGEFEGDWFIGTGCTPHSCTIEEGLVAASLTDRQLFLAWKPSGEDIVVRPPFNQWPERPRAALREWARTWP